MRYADARHASRKSTWIDDSPSPKQRSREAHDVVLDAVEHRLVQSVERGEWTTVAGFRAAKARHARSATATLRRPHKA
jgi:hypothetical protein